MNEFEVITEKDSGGAEITQEQKSEVENQIIEEVEVQKIS